MVPRGARCFLAALLGLAALYQLFQAGARPAAEARLDASVFDDLEGYGAGESSSFRPNASAVAELHEALARKDSVVERLTGELETLRRKHAQQEAAQAASAAPAAKAAPAPAPSGCAFPGADIVGHDISDAPASSVRACCERCAHHQTSGGRCQGWSFAIDGNGQQRCYLKDATAPRRPHDGVRSGAGNAGCCDALPTPAAQALPPPSRGPGGGSAAATLSLASEMCVMTQWWGGVRVGGEQLSAAKTPSPEQCCTLCAESQGGGCVGWTFNTVDHHCQTFREIHDSSKCNVCISGRLEADEGLPAGLLNEADPHALPATQQHAYARKVLAEALAEGRQGMARHRLPERAGEPEGARDIVIVACWRRPAFLLRTLAQLMRAAGAEQHFYLVLLDLHASPAVQEVAAALPLPHLLLHMPPHFFMEGGWGNSFSLLEGYRYARSLASQLRSSLVYLVEEDVFVARDFFQFHRAAHTDGVGLAGASASGGGAAASLCGDYPKGPVCVNTTSTLDRRRVLAVIAFNRDLIGPAAPKRLQPCRRYAASLSEAGGRPAAADPAGETAAAMVYAKPVYSSIGLSVGMDGLDKLVELAQPGYYEDPRGFIRKRFGGEDSYITRVYGGPEQWFEQDGLINRLMIEQGMVSILPRCPRAFHAGFVGYNRKHTATNDLKGATLQSRYEELASLSAEDMAARTSVPDVVPVPLEGFFVPKLRYCPRLSQGGAGVDCDEFAEDISGRRQLASECADPAANNHRVVPNGTTGGISAAASNDGCEYSCGALSRVYAPGQPVACFIDRPPAHWPPPAGTAPPHTYTVPVGSTAIIQGHSSEDGTERAALLTRIDAINASLVLRHVEMSGFAAPPQPSHDMFQDGGAVFVNGGDLTAEFCVFKENRAGRSGGALNAKSGAFVRVVGCLFDSNAAVQNGGAALRVYQQQRVEIIDSAFQRNMAQNGGAVLITGDAGFISATVAGCSGRDNEGKAHGCAVSIQPSGRFQPATCFTQQQLFVEADSWREGHDDSSPWSFVSVVPQQLPCILPPRVVAGGACENTTHHAGEARVREGGSCTAMRSPCAEGEKRVGSTSAACNAGVLEWRSVCVAVRPPPPRDDEVTTLLWALAIISAVALGWACCSWGRGWWAARRARRESISVLEDLILRTADRLSASSRPQVSPHALQVSVEVSEAPYLAPSGSE